MCGAILVHVSRMQAYITWLEIMSHQILSFLIFRPLDADFFILFTVCCHIIFYPYIILFLKKLDFVIPSILDSHFSSFPTLTSASP